MNYNYTITTKQKYKHLNQKDYEYIIQEISKHRAIHGNKIRNTGRTELVRRLAFELGTTCSTIYNIIKDAIITVVDSQLNYKEELSAIASFDRRSRKDKSSNHLKVDKANDFISLVVSELKQNKLASVDEIINDLKINRANEIEGLITICVKTMYSYIKAGLVDLKPIDMPRMASLKKHGTYKTYIAKRQRGTSIDERPQHIESRKEFGHWEGDLVTGPRDGKNGALLTLIERKTRFYYMIPIKNKTAKQVYMAINKLDKLYGEHFSSIFKSITFDNGSEFARYQDIEVKSGTSIRRTQVYFAHPYHSWERGSNENCNGLVRRYIKKGTDINKLDHKFISEVNIKINEKKRKIHKYQPSSNLFKVELNLINQSITNNLYL